MRHEIHSFTAFAVRARFLRAHPRWALAAGCGLAFLSAAVNACFLVRLGTSVGHLTGDVSRVAVEIASSQAGIHRSVSNLLAATLGFLTGAASAGFYIHHPNMELARPYGRSIIVIGLCLGVSHFMLPQHPSYAVGITAFACGLQNALATLYKGIVLRTTHLTGLLTDLGSNVGLRLRGHRIKTRRITVPLLLVFSFFAGAATGSALILSGNKQALLMIAGTYLTGGLGWSLMKYWLLSKIRKRARRSVGSAKV